MIELTQDVSWLAVVIGAVAAFAFGWLWYSPLAFGDRWAESMGVDKTGKMPMSAMTFQFIGLAMLSWFVGVTAVNSALLTLILGSAAFIVLGFSGETFAGHNRDGKLINLGYSVFAVIIMIAAQGLLG